MDKYLQESLEIVRPLLPPALFAPEAVAHLWQAARQLVPTPPLRAGFECRLGPDAPQVDLQQNFLAGPIEPPLLAAHVRKLIASPGSSAHPAWLRIAAFCATWGDPLSPLHAGIIDFWLEFDLAAGTPAQLAPSVFFGLNQTASPASLTWPIAEAALEILTGGRISPQLRRNLRGCFEECPPGAIVSHLGVMLARDAGVLRVNIKNLPAAGMVSFLTRLGWKENGERLAPLLAALCSYSDALTLCLDVGDEISPKIGLECFLKWQPGREGRWRAFIDRLVVRGLCTREKAEALMKWPGYTDPASTPAPWPASLMVQSMIGKPDRFTVLNRELMHIKVTWQPGGPAGAKAYFGFFYAWLLPGKDVNPIGGDRAKPELPAIGRRARGNDVGLAIEAAVQFLLSARSQTGWWLEYDDCEPEGPSDEWVTAYVSTVLAHLPDENARNAARWAWSLLENRVDSSGGWGWNLVMPPDTDSTVWGLRLAAAIGAEDSERARSAHEFLGQRFQANGALATYDEDTYRRIRGVTQIPATVRGWFGPHVCVIAAASLLSQAGEPAREFLRSAQRPDGSWNGYWWFDDEYTTGLAAEALASTGLREDASRVEQALHWAAGRVGANGAVASREIPGGSAFATACCVQTLALADSPERVRDPLTRALRWLLDEQRADGSWFSSAGMRLNYSEDPEKSLMETRGTLTTATVVSALQTVNQQFE